MKIEFASLIITILLIFIGGCIFKLFEMLGEKEWNN